MSDREARGALRDLAKLWGLQATYRNVRRETVRARTDTIVATLRGLGARIEGVDEAPRALRERRAEIAGRVIEPVVVAWDGRLDAVSIGPSGGGKIRVGVAEEGEDRPRSWLSGHAAASAQRFELRVPQTLPFGYHRLVLEGERRREEALVISAPMRAPEPARRGWGVFSPVYALRSSRDWGVGSMRELRELGDWLRERRGNVVATLPLLAQFLEGPLFEPGPYSPVSRLCWNELYVDVEGLPELAGSPEARAALRDPDLLRELTELRAAPLVDIRRAAAAKRRVLEPLAESVLASPPPAFREFLDARPEVREYARFRAEVERRSTWWGAWPAPERDGELSGKAEDDAAGRYHLFAQWVVDRQLGELASPSERPGLLLDLPLGVNAAGFDVWRERGLFVDGLSTGAPPDRFFTGGQNWGFPPPHPDRLRETGYRYPIACLRHLLRYASVLRVDHVMGLHRLFCIPSGRSAAEGMYVRYRPDEWYAVISLEAHRAGAAIVGEDLGVVPAYVRQSMRRHGILRTYVAEYEARPMGTGTLPEPPRACLASIDTHDMPPFARFWEGGDVDTRLQLGLLDHRAAKAEVAERARLRRAVADRLVALGLLAPEGSDDPRAVLDGCLAFLARSDAGFVVAALEDLWLEDRPQNVPGTTIEHPNWRIRMRHTVEELVELEDVERTLGLVADLRERAS